MPVKQTLTDSGRGQCRRKSYRPLKSDSNSGTPTTLFLLRISTPLDGVLRFIEESPRQWGSSLIPKEFST
ncbi:hypothetical protein X946_2156 [Burkholderia sp. ABCPW 111]|nr:hypothetical protein X946_2156 [Burkholderia sp. ABCPW 111]